MRDFVIRAEGLGKCYRIATGPQATNVTEALRASFSAVARRLGRDAPADSRYRDFWALRDVSFGVAPGEVVGVIGRNGAGKSTLLKLLSRITEPTCGSAQIRGRVGSLLEVGTGFHPDLSGRDNVYLNGAVLGMKRREIAAKFEEIVDFSGVRDFIDVPVKRYSSGMYVRLAFAVAAHLEPEILLVDEVLAVGDKEFREKSLGRIGEVARAGRTVIFVSHDLSSVATLCTRGFVLEQGRLAFDGAVGDAVERYLDDAPSRFADGLLDTAERSGTGELRVSFVRIADANGRPQLYSERPAVVTLGLAGHERVPGSHLTVSVEIVSALGEPLVTLSSRFDPRDPLGTVTMEDGVRLTCRVPELPLRPGRYLLNTRLERRGELLDEVREQVEFDVYPSDFFGSGALPADTEGPLLVRHEWQAVVPREGAVRA
jgi:homopolymeric O-antigen transport system ATP-binding protein